MNKIQDLETLVYNWDNVIELPANIDGFLIDEKYLENLHKLNYIINIKYSNDCDYIADVFNNLKFIAENGGDIYRLMFVDSKSEIQKRHLGFIGYLMPDKLILHLNPKL